MRAADDIVRFQQAPHLGFAAASLEHDGKLDNSAPIPIRAFSMMLVQKLMRTPDMLARLSVRAGIEGGVFIVSTLALLAIGILLHFFPNALGRNVAEAAPLVILALAVPGLRNLVEYQAELLFGRGQMLIRAMNLALLAGVKGVLLAWALSRISSNIRIFTCTFQRAPFRKMVPARALRWRRPWRACSPVNPCVPTWV